MGERPCAHGDWRCGPGAVPRRSVMFRPGGRTRTGRAAVPHHGTGAVVPPSSVPTNVMAPCGLAGSPRRCRGRAPSGRWSHPSPACPSPPTRRGSPAPRSRRGTRGRDGPVMRGMPHPPFTDEPVARYTVPYPPDKRRGRRCPGASGFPTRSAMFPDPASGSGYRRYRVLRLALEARRSGDLNYRVSENTRIRGATSNGTTSRVRMVASRDIRQEYDEEWVPRRQSISDPPDHATAPRA